MQLLGAAWPGQGAGQFRNQGNEGGKSRLLPRETERYDLRTLLNSMPSTLNHEEAYGGSCHVRLFPAWRSGIWPVGLSAEKQHDKASGTPRAERQGVQGTDACKMLAMRLSGWV